MSTYLSAKKVEERIVAGVPVIDVRTSGEFQGEHIAGTENVPLDGLVKSAWISEADKAAEVVVMCLSGVRSNKALDRLTAEGFENVFVLEGGIEAWKAAGLAVLEGESKVISIQRQVQITAGLMILTGVVLSQLVSGAWIYLAGFVGAGFVFAGLTNTCGMAIMLAAMPWNKAGCKSCSTS